MQEQLVFCHMPRSRVLHHKSHLSTDFEESIEETEVGQSEPSTAGIVSTQAVSYADGLISPQRIDLNIFLISDINVSLRFSSVSVSTVLNQMVELDWWQRVVCKFNCVVKEKILMCFFLQNKALTRDNLQRRNWDGLGRCYLCENVQEIDYHMIVDCLCDGTIIQDCLKSWCLNPGFKVIKGQPLIMA